MIINVGVGLKVIQLKFGTFLGPCFKCNSHGHFAKDCTWSNDVQLKVKDGSQLSQQVHENQNDGILSHKEERSIIEVGPTKSGQNEDNCSSTSRGLELSPARGLLWPRPLPCQVLFRCQKKPANLMISTLFLIRG